MEVAGAHVRRRWWPGARRDCPDRIVTLSGPPNRRWAWGPPSGSTLEVRQTPLDRAGLGQKDDLPTRTLLAALASVDRQRLKSLHAGRPASRGIGRRPLQAAPSHRQAASHLLGIPVSLGLNRK